MLQDMPYFMENEEWFRFDASVKKYILTSDAPPKAKESYEAFYKALEED